MTQPSPISGAAAVHSVDRLVYTVPDLNEARLYFDTFGLDARLAGDRLDLYTYGHPHRWASLFQAPGPKRLQYLRFGCYGQEAHDIAQRLDRLGIARSDPHPLGDDDGIWVMHPDGYRVQLAQAAKSSPDKKSVPIASPAPAPGQGAAPSRSQAHKVRPRRFAHALLFTPDAQRAIHFFVDGLGLRLTDRSGDVVVFLHGAHGSDHHMIGLAKSGGPGIHHTSWDVGSIDEVGLGMEQMLQAGHTRGWGVGRHVLGSNYFYYARDPWGSYAEYSFDIDYVPDGLQWQAHDHPLEDSFYVWGPAVPPDFTTNYEIQAE